VTPIDKETFSYWVTHPDDLAATDFMQLQESLATYPYCQSLYTLTAKAASIHQKGQTVPYVRQAAAYALSRNALRKLIDNEFQWSDNLLSRLNELSARHVPIPDDYQQESYAFFKSKAGLTGGLPRLTVPGVRLADQPEQLFIDPTPTIPTPEDPTLSESTLQQELTQIAEVPATPSPTAAELERQRQLELIDSFIQKEPSISRIQRRADEEQQQEDLAKRTTSGGGMFMTESFAKILIKQGKAEKAREIYQQLMHRNPQKNAYFAAKIAELDAGNTAAE
jgi:hypothetical protein